MQPSLLIFFGYLFYSSFVEMAWLIYQHLDDSYRIPISHAYLCSIIILYRSATSTFSSTFVHFLASLAVSGKFKLIMKMNYNFFYTPQKKPFNSVLVCSKLNISFFVWIQMELINHLPCLLFACNGDVEMKPSQI